MYAVTFKKSNGMAYESSLFLNTSCSKNIWNTFQSFCQALNYHVLCVLKSLLTSLLLIFELGTFENANRRAPGKRNVLDRPVPETWRRIPFLQNTWASGGRINKGPEMKWKKKTKIFLAPASVQSDTCTLLSPAHPARHLALSVGLVARGATPKSRVKE